MSAPAPYSPPSFHPLLVPPPARSEPERSAVRVLVVDDHPAVRDAVGRAVEAAPDLALAGVAGSGAEAFALVRAAAGGPSGGPSGGPVGGPVDVAVVDISLGDAHGLDLVQNVRAEAPALAVVVFSMYDEAVYAERALRAGALGYVRKSEPPSVKKDCRVRSLAAAESGAVCMVGG